MVSYPLAHPVAHQSKCWEWIRWPSGDGVPMVEDVVAAMQPYADQITIDFKTYLVVREFACAGACAHFVAALACGSI